MKLKQKIISILGIIISIQIYSTETIGLDEILNNFKDGSKFKIIKKLEKEKLRIKEIANKKNRWQKINYSISPTYNYYEDEDKMPLDLKLVEDLDRYPGNININLNYRELYMNLAYLDTHGNPDRTTYKIGFRKTLNDYLYNKDIYRKNSLKIESKQIENSLTLEEIRRKEEIIDNYVEVMNLLEELEIKRVGINFSKNRLKDLKKKKEIKEAVEIDIKYLELKIKKEKDEANYLKEMIKSKKIEIFQKIGLKSEYKLKPLNDPGDIKIKGDYLKVKNKDLEIEGKKEQSKYYFREKQPDINFDANYNLEEEIWTVGFVIQGNILEYGENLRVSKTDLEKLKIEKEEIKENLKNQERDLVIKYNNLLNAVKNKKKEMKHMKKRYYIDQEIYNKGYLNLIDLMESKKRYEESKLNYKKGLNELYGFKYKMKVK